MGYGLHITRQKDWFEDVHALKMFPGEWKAYVSVDPGMHFVPVTSYPGKTSTEDNNSASWTKLSGDQVFFNYDKNDGNIFVKNPDDEVIKKMLEIAFLLDARVQGDDGEYYDVKHPRNIATGNKSMDKSPLNPKPWWKLW